ncbi:MAG: tetratricopeptide repeat protein [Candidatus Coproplasma sp.]
MKKTDAIDLSADRLLSIASDCIENHEYIRALKMLNKNAVLNGNDEDSYMLYAEAFDDMGLYEKCINSWFKYLDYAGDGADFAEAYEGLAISYMNLGQEHFSAYYYNKLLMETDKDLTSQNRQEIISSFLNMEKPPLKFAYPPVLADYSKEIESGIDYMRENDYENAVKEFCKVEEGNEKYFSARNYIAMCNVICDKNEEAEQECLKILQKDPENIQALTTLSAVKSQQKQSKEAKELAYKLLKINSEDSEDLYKIATVCCENKLHSEAYNLFCRLDERFIYDCNLLYFKAISAYNSGQIDKSLEAFDTLLTIYPYAVTADYWYYTVLDERQKPVEERKELEYFYRLPRSESEANLTVLTSFNRLTDKKAQLLIKEIDLLHAIHWCLEEGDTTANEQLKLLGAFSALKGDYDDTVRDILLDAFMPDGVKMELLSGLAQRNKGGTYGIVLCNLYRCITLVPISVGRLKRKIFLNAYGLAFSRFAPLDREYPALIAVSAEALYAKLEKEERLSQCTSVPTLSASIVLYSGIDEKELNSEQICSFFSAKLEDVINLIG